MRDINRSLTVLADGAPVSFSHARLTGKDGIGLYPMPFTLRVRNLSDPDFRRLSSAKELSVLHAGSVLASGSVSDVYRRSVPEGTVTEAVFSAGLRLWETPVSLSVEAGVSVSETVRRILEASGTGISLLSFPGDDPVRTRGQAFCGSASECVMAALSAASARACLTPSGLCVIPAGGLPVSMTLPDRDLIDAPSFAAGNLVVLRTTVTGWPPGKMISASWKGETVQGLIIGRAVDADTMDGPWQAELLLEGTV